jgi:hypothetical protein
MIEIERRTPEHETKTHATVVENCRDEALADEA